MKKKNTLIKRRGRIILLVIALVLILSTASYFLFVYNNDTDPMAKMRKNSIQIIPHSEKSPLDERFLVLYCNISSINNDSVKVSVIEDENNTDKIFNDLSFVDVLVKNNTVIKKYDINEQKISDLNFSDVKVGDFATIYLKKTSSSVYDAIGIKVFNKNFINN
jgi:hypothetical protein